MYYYISRKYLLVMQHWSIKITGIYPFVLSGVNEIKAIHCSNTMDVRTNVQKVLIDQSCLLSLRILKLGINKFQHGFPTSRAFRTYIVCPSQ